MTFLGLEKPVEWQAQEVFNPSMANMVLNAQKDYVNALYADYQQGLQEMKEFKKEYGDFLTPILADQDWYNENVTGKVRDFLNNAYAQGVDLLRSPQGRAAITNMINNIDYGAVAKLRSSAETAKDYLKAKQKAIAEGNFDPDFEDFRLKGKSLSNWSTMDGDGIWQESSPGTFKDVNKWTSHLFDNMELSYDAEETKKHPGYLAYTKSRDTMNKIVDENIAQLLNTDLGKFYLNDAYNSIPDNFEGDRKQEALRRLKERVVNSNWEQGRIKLETDPYAYARYQSNLAAARAGYGRGSRGRQSGEDLSYNYLTGVFKRGVSIPFGYDPKTGAEQAINSMRKNQIAFGQSLRIDQPMGPWQAFKNRETQYMNKFVTYESPMMFASAIGRSPMNKTGAVFLTPEDARLLHSTADVVTHTYGYPNVGIDTETTKIPEPVVKITPDEEGAESFTSNIIMQPYRDVYTAYRKRGAIDGQWRVRLMDASTGKSYGDYWYDIPFSTEPNAVVPRINEWTQGSNGNYYAPIDKQGNEIGTPKIGVDPRISGQYETSSVKTNKELGVTKHDLNTNPAYNFEGVSISPF